MADHRPPETSPTTAIALIIATGMSLSGMDATAKYLSADLSLIMILWGRYFFHTTLTFVYYATTTRSLQFLRARRPGLQAIRAASVFAVTLFLYLALTRMQLADASAIIFLAPVLVTVISGLFLGEHVGPRRWMAVVFGFVGVLLVSRPGSGVLGWAALLPLAGAFMLALYMTLTRIIRTKDDPAATTFYSTALGALLISLIVPFYWQTMSTTQWALMITMGAIGAAGHFMLVKAFHSAEASVLAPFTYSQVIGAILWGYLVFRDIPSVWTLAGASVVIGSGLYVWYRETWSLRRKPSLHRV